MKIQHLLAAFALSYTTVAQPVRVVPVGEGVDGFEVNDLMPYNGQLLIAGWFYSFNGYPNRNLVLWDGGAGISSMGNVFQSPASWINDVIDFQGDPVIGGNSSGTLDSVFRWNGSDWILMGEPFNGRIQRFTVHDGDLYVGGEFTMSGATPVAHVARWDGAGWVAVGMGLNDVVRSVTSHNGMLYAAGDFHPTGIDPTAPEHLARWNGTQWEQVLDGIDGKVISMLSTPSELWFVGVFDASGDSLTALDNAGIFDGTFFQPIPVDLVASSAISIFEVGGLGIGIGSSDDLVTYDGYAFEESRVQQVKAVAELNGKLYAGGRFMHPSCAMVEKFGQLKEGTDHHWLRPSLLSGLITPTNMLFHDDELGAPGSEAPTGSGRSTIFAHRLFFVGVSADTLHFVSPEFSNHPSLGSGPNATDTSGTFCERYEQVWPVDIGMIWDHAAHWNDVGYQIPYSIASWPGNGNTLNGEPPQLAPFHDANANGLYEPVAGDYPLIRGESAAYYVLSDMESEGAFPDNPCLGIDVHVMVNGYHTSANEGLNNTLFVNYRVINRSPNTYDTLFVGSSDDLDIGNVNDDYMGCDTLLQMSYGYNADAYDEDFSDTPGYLDHPAAQGIVALNASLNASRVQANDGTWPGLFDPSIPGHYWNVVRGLHGTGDPIPDYCSGIVTRYDFPGDPVTGVGCTEADLMNLGYDRRIIQSYGPFFDIAPGDTICLDLAFVFAQDTAGDQLSSVALLKQRALDVRTWYDAQTLACNADPLLGIPAAPSAQTAGLHIFPNPASDVITVRIASSLAMEDLQLMDITGSLLRHIPVKGTATTVDLGDLPTGIYVLRAMTSHGPVVARVAKQ